MLDRLLVRRAGSVAAGFLLLGRIDILTLLGKWSLAMARTEPSWSVPAWLPSRSPAAPQSVANAQDSAGAMEASRLSERSRPQRPVDDFPIADGPDCCDVSICVRKTIVIQVFALCVEKFNAAFLKSLGKTALAVGVSSPASGRSAGCRPNEGPSKLEISRKSWANSGHSAALLNLVGNPGAGGTAFAMVRWQAPRKAARR